MEKQRAKLQEIKAGWYTEAAMASELKLSALEPHLFFMEPVYKYTMYYLKCSLGRISGTLWLTRRRDRTCGGVPSHYLCLIKFADPILYGQEVQVQHEEAPALGREGMD